MVSVSGIGIVISWPPSITGTNKTGSWQSQPIYSNVAGATFNGMKASGLLTSCVFSEVGDVYVGNRIYRPATYIQYT